MYGRRTRLSSTDNSLNNKNTSVRNQNALPSTEKSKRSHARSGLLSPRSNITYRKKHMKQQYNGNTVRVASNIIVLTEDNDDLNLTTYNMRR